MENLKVNAKFEKLPDNYSYDLYTVCTYKHDCDYRRYGIEIIKPDGTKVPLVGSHERPTAFAENPTKVYAMGDIRDTLVKKTIGDGEAYFYHVYGHGERTEKYLESCRHNIGLISVVCDPRDNQKNETDGTWKKIINEDGNKSGVFVKKIGDNYIAAYDVYYSCDGVAEMQFTFDHFPTKKDIKLAEILEDIRLDIGKKYWEYWNYFALKAGGGYEIKTRHWLDVDGDVEKKWCECKNVYIDEYC